MSLYTRVYEGIVERRERLLSGKINCIPWKLPRFELQLPGIEQGKYYLITANSKVGRFCPCRLRDLWKSFIKNIKNLTNVSYNTRSN